MSIFSSLKREQKESIILLQFGTFLEYFDLLLYVHMAVVLNDLFFPSTDSHTAALLSSFALCTTYVFRPLGAIIFGWIGDNIGRKSTIILTTTMMALACVTMALLPTYAEIGITASVIMILCRIFQGMSSLGEVVGAEIYLTETIKRPSCFPAVSFLEVSYYFGGLAALGIASIVTSFGFNWRLAFWGGAIIAVIGAIARIRLRETPEFLDMKRKWMKCEINKINIESNPSNGKISNDNWREPIEVKTLISYLLISIGSPLFFYITFIYFTPTLKNTFGYGATDIINHNLLLTIVAVFYSIIISYLSYYVYPLKINRIRAIISLFVLLFMPLILSGNNSITFLFIFQCILIFVTLHDSPSSAILLSHFPLYKRFTCASLLFAFARAIMFCVTSFGFIYLTDWFGLYGTLFITLPIAIGYLYGLNHFKNLEIKLKLYPSLS